MQSRGQETLAWVGCENGDALFPKEKVQEPMTFLSSVDNLVVLRDYHGELVEKRRLWIQ